MEAEKKGLRDGLSEGGVCRPATRGVVSALSSEISAASSSMSSPKGFNSGLYVLLQRMLTLLVGEEPRELPGEGDGEYALVTATPLASDVGLDREVLGDVG